MYFLAQVMYIGRDIKKLVHNVQSFLAQVFFERWRDFCTCLFAGVSAVQRPTLVGLTNNLRFTPRGLLTR
jgi:hypothetical protein